MEEPEGPFNDVARMYESGVAKGRTTAPLDYRPDKPATKTQMASFFVRAINIAPTNSGE